MIELSFHLIFFPFTTRIPPQLEITRVFRTLSFFWIFSELFKMGLLWVWCHFLKFIDRNLPLFTCPPYFVGIITSNDKSVIFWTRSHFMIYLARYNIVYNLWRQRIISWTMLNLNDNFLIFFFVKQNNTYLVLKLAQS